MSVTLGDGRCLEGGVEHLGLRAVIHLHQSVGAPGNPPGLLERFNYLVKKEGEAEGTDANTTHPTFFRFVAEIYTPSIYTPYCM